MHNFDIVIVGGSLIGCALAYGLNKSGFSVAVIEKRKKLLLHVNNPDTQILAINNNSINFLKKIDAWSNIKKFRTFPYHTMEVWELEKLYVEFTARSLQLSKLGYMIEHSVLCFALWNMLKKRKNIFLCIEDLKNIERYHNGWMINTNKSKLYAKLIIGADGYDSKVRKISGISINSLDYRQSCLLISIYCKTKLNNIVWQKFTPKGPRAFLPISDHLATIVWYDHPEYINKLKEISFTALKKKIKNHFPKKLKDFHILSIKSFKLMRFHAVNYVKNNLVLVGDAAHKVHPLAGQGANLGYRDIDILIDILTKARTNDEPWYSLKILYQYQKLRYKDNLLTQYAIDFLYFSFGNQFFPLKIVRNASMFFLQRSEIIKKKILQYMLLGL